MSNESAHNDPLAGIDPARIAEWEKLGVDCIETDLKQRNGLTYIGAQHAVEWAWRWVRHKRAQEEEAKKEVVTLKPTFYGFSIDLKSIYQQFRKRRRR
jgi:hypothetical protein